MRLCYKLEFANTFGRLCETVALQLSKKKRTFKGSNFGNERMRMCECRRSSELPQLLSSREPYCNKKRQRSSPGGSASTVELRIGYASQRRSVRGRWEANGGPFRSKISLNNYCIIIFGSCSVLQVFAEAPLKKSWAPGPTKVRNAQFGSLPTSWYSFWTRSSTLLPAVNESNGRFGRF